MFNILTQTLGDPNAALQLLSINWFLKPMEGERYSHSAI